MFCLPLSGSLHTLSTISYPQMTVEDQVTATLADRVAAAIRSKCNCHYPSSHIIDTILLCRDTQVESPAHIEMTSPSNRASYVTFRGKLLSVTEHNPDNLVEYLDAWVDSEPRLGLRIQGQSDSSLDVKLSPFCPVRLKRWSEHLCSIPLNSDGNPVLPNTQPIEVNDTDTYNSDCVSIPIFVASLVAEFFLLLMVFLVGIIITLLIVFRRDRK